MERKPETSKIWQEKAMNVESALNMIAPKFTGETYPHIMLRLELACGIISIHLSLMKKLMHLT